MDIVFLLVIVEFIRVRFGISPSAEQKYLSGNLFLPAVQNKVGGLNAAGVHRDVSDSWLKIETIQKLSARLRFNQKVSILVDALFFLLFQTEWQQGLYFLI